jgi:hypothetical protein
MGQAGPLNSGAAKTGGSVAKQRAIERKNQTLDETAITATIELLRRRVAERFPDRGLAQTAGFLVELSKTTAHETARLREINWLLLLLQGVALAIGVAAMGLFADLMPDVSFGGLNVSDVTQALDAAFNIVVLVGIALVFLAGLDTRFKRSAALAGLYRLRAISHVIDMHQLTKDPASLLGHERTGSSPARDLSRDQLLRYLDYCAEMLSMIGKLAALYVQGLPDPVVISGANDIEVLTANLSRKIWQKIEIVKDEGAL